MVRLDVVAFRRPSSSGFRFVLSPSPAADLRRVLTVLVDILFVIDESVADRLFGICGSGSQLRHPVDDVLDEIKTVDVVEDAHIEGRGGCPLFLITADVQVFVVGAPVGQAMDQPRVAVKGKDNRLVGGKERIKIFVVQSVRMLARRLQGH